MVCISRKKVIDVLSNQKLRKINYRQTDLHLINLNRPPALPDLLFLLSLAPCGHSICHRMQEPPVVPLLQRCLCPLCKIFCVSHNHNSQRHAMVFVSPRTLSSVHFYILSLDAYGSHFFQFRRDLSCNHPRHSMQGTGKFA